MAAPEPVPAITIDGVAKRYPTRSGAEREALHGVDLTLPASSFVAVIGPSGCGKSTLLRLIGGLDHPDAGTITVGDATPDELRRRGGIGLVPQSPALLPWRSVVDNLRLLDQLGPWSEPRLSRADTARWLERVELADEADLLPHQLSGGMQQRVSLARAFALEPVLLLLDEPFSALDELTRHHMQELATELWADSRPSVLFVTHSIDEAVKLADRVVVMAGQPGRVVDDIDVDLARPRTVGIEDTVDFRAHTARIRAALMGGGSEAVDDSTEGSP